MVFRQVQFANLFKMKINGKFYESPNVTIENSS